MYYLVYNGPPVTPGKTKEKSKIEKILPSTQIAESRRKTPFMSDRVEFRGQNRTGVNFGGISFFGIFCLLSFVGDTMVNFEFFCLLDLY